MQFVEENAFTSYSLAPTLFHYVCVCVSLSPSSLNLKNLIETNFQYLQIDMYSSASVEELKEALFG